jgi:hypothetical protein
MSATSVNVSPQPDFAAPAVEGNRNNTLEPKAPGENPAMQSSSSPPMKSVQSAPVRKTRTCSELVEKCVPRRTTLSLAERWLTSQSASREVSRG